MFQALLDSLEELYPGCTVHGICRRPATQPPVFPAVRWHAALGGSYRQGIRRGLENATGLVLGLLEVGPSLLVPIPSRWCSPRARAHREADLVIVCPGGYLEDSHSSIVMHLAHLCLALPACRRRAASCPGWGWVTA